MNRRRLLTGLAILAVALSSGAHRVEAALITIPNGNPFSPADNAWTWKVSWDPALNLDLTIRWDPATRNMQKLLNIGPNDPSLIRITFEQVARADTFDRFGLRFTLSELVINSTGNDWSVFLLQVTDDGLRAADFKNQNPNLPANLAHPNDRGRHPTKAHFHGDSNGRFDFGPLVPLNEPESGDFIQLGLGRPVQNTRVLTGGGIGIHVWERVGTLQNPNLRKFDLIEGPVELIGPPRPIPEPATLALWSIGLAVLFARFRDTLTAATIPLAAHGGPAACVRIAVSRSAPRPP